MRRALGSGRHLGIERSREFVELPGHTESLRASLELLHEAEQRIGGQVTHESAFPSPDEEIEAVLPADVLAALDEPLEDEEDDDLELGAHASRAGFATAQHTSTS